VLIVPGSITVSTSKHFSSKTFLIGRRPFLLSFSILLLLASLFPSFSFIFPYSSSFSFAFPYSSYPCKIRQTNARTGDREGEAASTAAIQVTGLSSRWNSHDVESLLDKLCGHGELGLEAYSPAILIRLAGKCGVGLVIPVIPRHHEQYQCWCLQGPRE